MNYTILFSALQDMQSGLFSDKQAVVKENRYVHSFALLVKVVHAMRARRPLADAMKRWPRNRDLREAYEKQCPDGLRWS